MPRPATKKQLLDEIEREHIALDEFLSTLTAEEMTRPDILGPWSVKDVMAHLLEWEQMFLGWYKAGLKGKIAEKPAPDFKWSQLPELNQYIFEKYRDLPLQEVKNRFRASYRQILRTIQGIEEKDIFSPRRFAWTEKLALISYIYPNTSSHYRWARNEIKKGMKRKGRS